MPQGDVATVGHRHVCCDGCHRLEFPGRRYRCLRCDDYDLCGPCYDLCVQTEQHLMDHPMQLILLEPQQVPELLNGGGAVEELNLSNCYTCPYCKVMGHTAKGLIHHVYALHSEDDSYVVCPMCACLPGESMMTMQNLSRHLLTNHIDYANFLEPQTPPLPRLPQEAAPNNSRRLRRRHSHGHLHPHYQQENSFAYAQMVYTGQFATDTLPDLSNVLISQDLMNNLRSLYTDEEIASMMGHHDTEILMPTDTDNSLTANQVAIPVDPPPEKRREKKERRPKTEHYLLSKWMAGEQKQWEMSAEANKIRQRQAIFTEQILLSMMCEKELELPKKDTLEVIETNKTEEPLKNGKDMQPLETGENTQTLEQDTDLLTLETEQDTQPLLDGTDLLKLENETQKLDLGTLTTGTHLNITKTPTDQKTPKTSTDFEPKISDIMSLMSSPWTQVLSAAQTDDGNGTAIKQFIQLMGATTDETQVDEMVTEKGALD